jgi:hypothetical protein
LLLGPVQRVTTSPMFGAVKLLWNWGAKWFDRYEFLDFVTNKLGLTSVVTKILPAGGAVVMALVAYVGRAPWYIILLAALCAVVLILTGIRLTQIILKEESKSGKSKITETVPRRKSAVPKNIPAGTPSSSVSILQSNIGGFLAIAAAVIIASVGTTLYNNWTTYKEKLDQTSLVVIPIPHPPVPDHNQSFGLICIGAIRAPCEYRESDANTILNIPSKK